uniref:Chromosomal protein D1-like n=1 Tax=Cyprinodon variegatus TaxID=28743 RepID=A0A3Q2G1P9_CYPVA
MSFCSYKVGRYEPSSTRIQSGSRSGTKDVAHLFPSESKIQRTSGNKLIQDDSDSPSQRGREGQKVFKTKATEQQDSGEELTESSVTIHKRRGRPKGSKKQTSSEKTVETELSPKKRGRPRKSDSVKKPVAEGIPNGSSDAPKRGRPKGSVKRKSESLTSGEEDECSPVTPRKRGRPKGARNKKSRMEREYSDWDAEAYRAQKSVKTLRGRPRKPVVKKNVYISEPLKRGRGRPKGSLNKKPSSLIAHGKVGRPRKIFSLPVKGRKPGRPRLQPGKRGRPRKYPLPSPEELKKPKVWKPLGRPRKYPRKLSSLSPHILYQGIKEALD